MAEVPQIDGYSDLVQVAKGGFGVVYRARQDRFGRTVALKVLNVADLDDRGQQRFERECIAMGSLGWHPNVVAVFDSGITADGHPWLSMEYLEGGSLGDRLKHGPLPWQEAVIAGVQVAGALDAAHAAGILHRDLKPENLLIGPYTEVKLADFGIAAVEGSARTTTGHASFTAHHVAPEILRRQRPSEQSDLYGLASTLHALIVGAAPFSGEPDEPIDAVIASVLGEPAPRIDGVPEDLADLLARSLAKDPADRPASAGEFGRGLQRIQADHDLPVTDLRLSPNPRTRTPGAESPTTTAPGQPTESHRGDPLPTLDHRPPESHRGDPFPTIDHQPESLSGDPLPTVARTPPDVLRPSPPLSRRPGSSPNEPDTGLLAPGPAAVEVDARPRSRRRVAIILAIATLLGVGAILLTSTRHDPTDGIIDTIPVGQKPEGVAATDTAVWVTDRSDGTVTRIDPSTNETIATIPVGSGPQRVTATDAAVWVTNSSDNTVTRIDPDTNETIATIPVGSGPIGVATTDNALWIASAAAGRVTRIDPSTNETIASIALGSGQRDVAATDAAVWVTNTLDDTVKPIDPDTNQTTARIPVGSPAGVAATEDAVWVTNSSDNTVTRIDPNTNETITTVPVGSGPRGVAATNTDVWVTNTLDDTVTRIDPDTNETITTIPVGSSPLGVAITATAVWVTNSGDNTVTRIDLGSG